VKAIKAGPEAVEKYLNDKEEQIRKIAEQESNDCQCSCQKKRRVSERPNASGKAITDDSFFSDMTNYLEQKSLNTIKKKSTQKPVSKEPKTFHQWFTDEH